VDHTTSIIVQLFIVFMAAQVGTEIAQRLRLPSVVGEIIAGVIVGASVLGWVDVGEPLGVLSEIGAVLLLFSVGLETRLGDLRQVGRVAAQVGVVGVVVPFGFGAAFAFANGFPAANAMFIASAFVATSAGITARVLYDMGALRRIESRVILGAAVIDDILAMLILGAVTALQGDRGVDAVGLALVFAQALGFVAIIALVGTRLMRRSSPLLEVPINPLSPLTISRAGGRNRVRLSAICQLRRKHDKRSRFCRWSRPGPRAPIEPGSPSFDFEATQNPCLKPTASPSRSTGSSTRQRC